MITINYRDPRPVYRQIVDRLRELIVTGVIAPDEKLPSVRDMAARLSINPNTIQRALRELEQAGYIYAVAGRGHFAGGHSGVDRQRAAQLLKTLTETARELRYLGFSEEQIVSHLKNIGGQEESDA